MLKVADAEAEASPRSWHSDWVLNGRTVWDIKEGRVSGTNHHNCKSSEKSNAWPVGKREKDNIETQEERGKDLQKMLLHWVELWGTQYELGIILQQQEKVLGGFYKKEQSDLIHNLWRTFWLLIGEWSWVWGWKQAWQLKDQLGDVWRSKKGETMTSVQ